MRSLMFDGGNVKNVTLESAFGWQNLTSSYDDPLDSGFDHEGVAAYNRVPFVRRAVDLRAAAVASVPHTIKKGNREIKLPSDDYPWLSNLSELLRKIEVSVCVYGSCYLMVESNRYGLNKQLRWITPTTVIPKFDDMKGLVSFQRTVGNTNALYKPIKDICYYWEPNIAFDIGPGISPIMVAVTSAKVLHGVSVFAESYFRRGAIKATLLQVDGNPAQSEMTKLEDWWKKLITGVKQAWSSVAIRANVNPMVIGDGVKELDNMALVMQYQREVCAALGIPVSVVSDDAANYATANQDTINMWTLTLIPRINSIAEWLNFQFFNPMDMSIEFNTDEIEVLQEAQLNQAKSASDLYSSGVLTIDEVRAIIGFPPMPEEEKELAKEKEIDKEDGMGNSNNKEDEDDEDDEEDEEDEEKSFVKNIQFLRTMFERYQEIDDDEYLKRRGSWNPNDHPRDKYGRFTRTGSTSRFTARHRRRMRVKKIARSKEVRARVRDNVNRGVHTVNKLGTAAKSVRRAANRLSSLAKTSGIIAAQVAPIVIGGALLARGFRPHMASAAALVRRWGPALRTAVNSRNLTSLRPLVRDTGTFLNGFNSHISSVFDHVFESRKRIALLTTVLGVQAFAIKDSLDRANKDLNDLGRSGRDFSRSMSDTVSSANKIGRGMKSDGTIEKGSDVPDYINMEYNKIRTARDSYRFDDTQRRQEQSRWSQERKPPQQNWTKEETEFQQGLARRRMRELSERRARGEISQGEYEGHMNYLINKNLISREEGKQYDAYREKLHREIRDRPSSIGREFERQEGGKKLSPRDFIFAEKHASGDVSDADWSDYIGGLRRAGVGDAEIGRLNSYRKEVREARDKTLFQRTEMGPPREKKIDRNDVMSALDRYKKGNISRDEFSDTLEKGKDALTDQDMEAITESILDDIQTGNVFKSYKAYDPKQPRDKLGRFASTGSRGGAAKPPAPKPKTNRGKKEGKFSEQRTDFERQAGTNRLSPQAHRQTRVKAKAKNRKEHRENVEEVFGKGMTTQKFSEISGVYSRDEKVTHSSRRLDDGTPVVIVMKENRHGDSFTTSFTKDSAHIMEHKVKDKSREKSFLGRSVPAMVYGTRKVMPHVRQLFVNQYGPSDSPNFGLAYQLAKMTAIGLRFTVRTGLGVLAGTSII